MAQFLNILYSELCLKSHGLDCLGHVNLVPSVS